MRLTGIPGKRRFRASYERRLGNPTSAMEQRLQLLAPFLSDKSMKFVDDNELKT